jgi:hypothetical protein
LLCAASCTFRLVFLPRVVSGRVCLSYRFPWLVVCGATACCLRHVAPPVPRCKTVVGRACSDSREHLAHRCLRRGERAGLGRRLVHGAAPRSVPIYIPPR